MNQIETKTSGNEKGFSLYFYFFSKFVNLYLVVYLVHFYDAVLLKKKKKKLIYILEYLNSKIWRSALYKLSNSMYHYFVFYNILSILSFFILYFLIL